MIEDFSRNDRSFYSKSDPFKYTGKLYTSEYVIDKECITVTRINHKNRRSGSVKIRRSEVILSAGELVTFKLQGLSTKDIYITTQYKQKLK